MKADSEAYDYLQKYIESLFQYRDKYFGNAREIRKLIVEAVQNQNLRLASLSKDERSKEMLELEYDQVAADMAKRDQLDSTRATSPLLVAPDAVYIDTTDRDAVPVDHATRNDRARTVGLPGMGQVQRH